MLQSNDYVDAKLNMNFLAIVGRRGSSHTLNPFVDINCEFDVFVCARVLVERVQLYVCKVKLHRELQSAQN